MSIQTGTAQAGNSPRSPAIMQRAAEWMARLWSDDDQRAAYGVDVGLALQTVYLRHGRGGDGPERGGVLIWRRKRQGKLKRA
ncbi:hypothetical protein [Janthinobacterium sp.]|uniref:hypothetical protein n=1 Tax=Janthinobacterium sp. TaxID=1871054 RepID=UPI0026376747|nr:hypothetical protein [Janthinobacterium sp.]